MQTDEYLVSYGAAGDFSRFRPAEAAVYQRGERVVIRTSRGTELGTVLCSSTLAHEAFLSRVEGGDLLRRASDTDEAASAKSRRLADDLVDSGRRLARELGLRIEILDAEVTLDGGHASIYHLRGADCDCRPLTSALVREHDVTIAMENLALPAEPAGCGKPDCGKGAGGCATCGSGGGCSSGSCGAGHNVAEVASHLADLRQAMEARTPLL